MNITCIICSDTLTPSSDVFATPCGHLFHYVCLVTWIERSRTCPQCRCRTTDKTIHRIYFNVANTDHIVDDAATLQSKLDNLQFQMSLKEKDIKNFSEKYRKMKSQNSVLREDIAELENKIRSNDSVVHALKDQVSFFKSKSRECDRLIDEVAKLKSRLKDVEVVQTALHGTREDLNNILRTDSDPQSLVILAATLKKALVDAEKKKMTAEHKFKQLQNEAGKYRTENSSLQLSNEELRKQLQLLKSSWEIEKDYLTDMVLEKRQSKSDKNNSSLKRIVTESPIPIPKKNFEIKNNSTVSDVDSPSVEEKVTKILNSKSPYLPVKSSILNVDYQPQKSQRNESSLQGSSRSKDVSIFKRSHSKLLGHGNSHTEVVNSGLGGHHRNEIFASPRVRVSGFKRQTTNSSTSSSKLRKLNSMSFLKTS